MFFSTRKKREQELRDAERDVARRKALRARLDVTLDAVLVSLRNRHELSPSLARSVADKAKELRLGMNLVLINNASAFDDSIPTHLRGGAIIANSVDAFSSAAAALDQIDLEATIGSPNDEETKGHMCHQLGFSRDGSALVFNSLWMSR